MKNINNYMIIALIVLALPLSMIGCGGSDSDSDNNMTVADLAGTWENNSLASGTDAPWWERGTLTVNSDGTFTGSMTESGGSTSTPSGTLSISNDGIITLPGFATLQGSMDSGKTVMVWTNTWGSGTTDIKVFTKKSGTYSLADLAGTWENNSLASGTDAPWWERGTLTVNSDGTFTASMTGSDGSTSTPSGTLSISNDGIITLQGLATLQGSMDSGKTVMVWTNTWGSGTTDIEVFTKKSGTYSLADLAGTWENNSLASGTDAPWWERGTLTVNSDGTFTASMTESDGSTGTPSGTLNISNDGIITLQGSATLQGSMDSGKTVMVWTDTWGSGTTEIKVITKK